MVQTRRVLPCYTKPKGGTIPLSVAFTDVGPKVQVSYYGHFYCAQFLCRHLSNGETATPLPTMGGAANCAKGIQDARFSNGQKLTHAHAQTKKHAGQGTPVHYTH